MPGTHRRGHVPKATRTSRKKRAQQHAFGFNIAKVISKIHARVWGVPAEGKEESSIISSSAASQDLRAFTMAGKVRPVTAATAICTKGTTICQGEMPPAAVGARRCKHRSKIPRVSQGHEKHRTRQPQAH
ncbi:YPR174C-like protein [Saccharomyces cerevisiae x Saccharomyces kudriavzevii VIN7]|uniref:YPR174C-like protein n=1 Tax=Saccharomyces cerevisiae x Saccharomyces kudriavzevii (strain VIN7) TaxID=1095631 RepID=H0H2M0_SACCK|nr:YPR174C-like protein [Saccharomyces cerevisiae x Saccharomyces kudriavzevii VIN7]